MLRLRPPSDAVQQRAEATLGLLRRLTRLLFGSRPHARPAPPIRVVARQRTRVVVTSTTVSVTSPAPSPQRILRGRCWVIDGDTIEIDGIRLRIAGIDAPELDHPWGQRSKWAMVALCKGQIVTAHIKPELSYDRVVAQCFLPDGRDLAAELVRAGLALDWPAFSGGKYRSLETPEARRKLWRADARQRGRFIPQHDD